MSAHATRRVAAGRAYLALAGLGLGSLGLANVSALAGLVNAGLRSLDELRGERGRQYLRGQSPRRCGLPCRCGRGSGSW